MSPVRISSTQNEEEILPLIQTAIENEIRRLEISLKLARQRLAKFERKYGVASDYFIKHMAAEDLTGGDDEFVQWAGEYELAKRLERKIHYLKNLTYNDSDLL